MAESTQNRLWYSDFSLGLGLAKSIFLASLHISEVRRRLSWAQFGRLQSCSAP